MAPTIQTLLSNLRAMNGIPNTSGLSFRGIFQSDIIIGSALANALAAIREEPWLLDYAFAILRKEAVIQSTPFTYGAAEVDQIKKWFLNTDIRLVFNSDPNRLSFPCISITLAASDEIENTLGDRDAEGSQDVDMDDPSAYTLTAPFTPTKYDPTTGTVVLPTAIGDMVILASDRMGLVTKFGTVYPIQTVLDAYTFQIEEGVADDFTDAILAASQPSFSVPVESASFRETYQLGIHVASEPAKAIYLHSIVVFAMLRYRQAMLESRGFERSYLQSQDFNQNVFFEKQLIYSRFLNIAGYVRHYWPKLVAPKIGSFTESEELVFGPVHSDVTLFDQFGAVVGTQSDGVPDTLVSVDTPPPSSIPININPNPPSAPPPVSRFNGPQMIAVGSNSNSQAVIYARETTTWADPIEVDSLTHQAGPFAYRPFNDTVYIINTPDSYPSTATSLFSYNLATSASATYSFTESIIQPAVTQIGDRLYYCTDAGVGCYNLQTNTLASAVSLIDNLGNPDTPNYLFADPTNNILWAIGTNIVGTNGLDSLVMIYWIQPQGSVVHKFQLAYAGGIFFWGTASYFASSPGKVWFGINTGSTLATFTPIDTNTATMGASFASPFFSYAVRMQYVPSTNHVVYLRDNGIGGYRLAIFDATTNANVASSVNTSGLTSPFTTFVLDSAKNLLYLFDEYLNVNVFDTTANYARIAVHPSNAQASGLLFQWIYENGWFSR